MDLYQRLQDASRLHALHRTARLQHAIDETASYFKRRKGPDTWTPTSTPFPDSERESSQASGRGSGGGRDWLHDSQGQGEGQAAAEGAEEEEDDGLSVEERRQLQEENRQLQRNLESYWDRTKEVERQVVEISHLQTLIANKVVQQRDVVDELHRLTIDGVAKVESGNDELRKAARSGRDFRIFVLLFLVVCSFSILFLHWYA